MGLFRDLLDQNKYVILHGALGTELESQGYDVSDKLWSAKYLISQPDVIEKIHENYVLSGSDIVTTSSYQATLPGLKEHGLSEKESEDIIRLTVKLAKNARDKAWAQISDAEKAKRPYPLISGDIGPYAAYLADASEYTGQYKSMDKEALKAFHKPRIALLLEEGVDLLAVETIPNFEEIQAIAEIIQKDFPNIESYFSFTSQDGINISDGTPIEQIATYCDSIPQILAMGLNCCSPTIYEKGLTSFNKITKKPLVAYSNSGEVYDQVTKKWSYPQELQSSSFNLLEYVQKWQSLGVKIVGGCCRTHPKDIQSLYTGLRLENKDLPTIRRATEKDIPAINNLLAQVLSVHHDARPDIFKATGNKFSDEELAELLKKDHCPVFVYVNEKNQVLAHLFCEISQITASNLQPIKNLFIEDLCVDKNARGQRIGKKLYEFAINYAKKIGCHNLTLDAWYDNVGAYRFYERLGMKPQKN